MVYITETVQWGANPLNTSLDAYANQASPYFLGYHLAFPASHLKSDVVVVGFSAIHHSTVLSSQHGLLDRFLSMALTERQTRSCIAKESY